VTPDPFAAAASAIFAAFADRERIVYTQAGVVLPPIAAIRIDADAGDLLGSTPASVAYEIRQADLPAAPSKRDHFTHRGRRWTVEERKALENVAGWRVFVVDAGPAA
jgi:hypothetical protein